MTLLLIAFIAGLLTVLAPCVLPLLPVIVGGSLSDGAQSARSGLRRALTITIALGLSVIAFTLLLKVSTLFITIPPEVWQWISGGIITIFGIITVFPEIWEKLPWTAQWNRSSNQLLAVGYKRKGFWGDVIIGAALGPVFSTCSPTYFIVLATVLPQSLAMGLVDMLAYTLGLCISLLMVALVGQRIVGKLGAASDPHGWFKRSVGVLFLIVGVMIMTGADKKLQLGLLNAGFFDVTKIEQRLLQNNTERSLPLSPVDATAPVATSMPPSSITPPPPVTKKSLPAKITVPGGPTSASPAVLAAKAVKYPLAPELVSPSGYVNTGGVPITLAQYKGKKVVLLDIWTYSCINCQRTLPYVTAWYQKYKDMGLEIVGLHTPEFAFEKVQKNVEDATKRFGVTYPVVLDNNYATWNAYGNAYWPRKYLIDIDGYIIYDHIGEGNYDETERAIQKALTERAERLGEAAVVPAGITAPTNVVTVEPGSVASPEIYFGSSRNQYFGNGVQGKAGEQQLTVPPTQKSNTLYLGGTWNLSDEYAENKTADAKIVFTYKAKSVYFVGSSVNGVEMEVWRDGKQVGVEAGADVKNGVVLVKEDRLYKLIEDPSSSGEHTLELRIKTPGLKAFTFTFG